MRNAWHRKQLWFSSATREEQVRWLSRLLFQISVFARDTYEVGTDNLTNPQKMRRFNELMHRITLHQLAFIDDDPKRFSDEIFFQFLSESLQEVGLRRSDVLKFVK